MVNQKDGVEMVVEYEQIYGVLTDVFSKLEGIKESKPYTYKTFMWAFIEGFDSIKPHAVDEGTSLGLKKVQEVIAKKVLSVQGGELKDLFGKEIAAQQKQINEEGFHE